MRPGSMIRLIAIGICAVIAIACAVPVVRYADDYFSARRVNQALSAQYHDGSSAAPSTDAPLPVPTEAPTPVPTDAPAPVPTAAPAAPEAPAATAAAAPASTYDPFGGYPDNRYREVTPAFRTLQKTNQDICGWITIGTDLDQAVVQRDNQFYLDHDYTGRHNQSGAIFLDEQVQLWQRPTCYILYGHNMKTEAMFGMLHKYDRLPYLREHAVITFNTQYEDGQFAVFASGTTRLDPASLRFVDFYDLPGAAGEAREAILGRLRRVSDYSIPLEVSADDQLLILVTCVGDDQERRFVAARRLREGEDAASLYMTYLLAEHR